MASEIQTNPLPMRISQLSTQNVDRRLRSNNMTRDLEAETLGELQAGSPNCHIWARALSLLTYTNT